MLQLARRARARRSRGLRSFGVSRRHLCLNQATEKNRHPTNLGSSFTDRVGALYV
jgi:hypothetical protein